MTTYSHRTHSSSSFRTPPEIPVSTKPPIHSLSELDMQLESQPRPGVVYEPGTYPTPELMKYSLGHYRVLSEGPYTETTIQAALDSLGSNTTLYLAKNTTWSISSAITLQPFQELASFGYPNSESEMALLEATEECRPYMFTCFDKDGIRIRNLAIDGGREKYGWLKGTGCMISLGRTAVNQVVDSCIIRHPRGWSCIQAFEGSHNIRITNNQIGPAGVGEHGQWADGVSFAGYDGLVAGNKIVDATDGAIVLFGAPGTLCTSNTIITRSRIGLGAINMVDWGPHDGNYAYTRVLHNTIVTEGSYVKIGIAQGGTCWGENRDRLVNRGGIVMNNLITTPKHGSGSIGYGFPVADVSEWTCLQNAADPQVTFEGDISHTWPNLLVSPGPFVTNHASLTGPARLQPEFVRGRISVLISIQPGASKTLSWGPGSLKLDKLQKISVEGRTMSFDDTLFITDKATGKKTWELNWDRSEIESESAHLIFREDGRLYVVEDFGEGWEKVYHDLIPILPKLSRLADPMVQTQMILSSFTPNLIFAPSPNPSNSVFFMNSYDIRIGQEFRVGHLVLRQPDHKDKSVLLYALSPYAQWVILSSVLPLRKFDLEMDPTKSYYGLIQWGGLSPGRCNDHRWNVVWTSPNEPLKTPIFEGGKAPMLAFQGDGNLVIYADGGVQWASNTHGRQPLADHISYGLDGNPWVKLLGPDGSTYWQSN